MNIWKTDLFNGGMNDWIDPSLLESGVAVELVNADISTGRIKALKRPVRIDETDPVNLGHYGSRVRNVVKWYDRYYWSDNTAVDSGFYGGYPENFLGMPYPFYTGQGANVSIAAAAPEDNETGLTGSFKYCVCFVSENGWEGAPGSSEEYETGIELADQFAAVTVTWSDSRIAYAKIYRTTASGADYYCVGEIRTSGDTFTDKTPDETLVMLNPLTTADNLPPPERGKYLTEYNGVFFLAAGSLLYYSVQGNPHAWPVLQYLNFDDEITGIAPEFMGILVFTKNHVWRVVGAESSATLTKTYIPGNHGCLTFRSISVLNNAPVWLSAGGICLWDGSTVQVVSYRRIITGNEGVRYAVSAHDCYYLFLTSGCIVLDRRNGDVFRKLDFTCNYAWFDGNQNLLYLQTADSLYQFGTGEPLRYRYKSPVISSTKTAKFKELEICISGTGQASARIDGVRVMDLAIPSGRSRLKLGVAGRSFQLDITGTGTLDEIEVKYE